MNLEDLLPEIRELISEDDLPVTIRRLHDWKNSVITISGSFYDTLILCNLPKNCNILACDWVIESERSINLHERIEIQAKEEEKNKKEWSDHFKKRDEEYIRKGGKISSIDFNDLTSKDWEEKKIKRSLKWKI